MTKKSTWLNKLQAPLQRIIGLESGGVLRIPVAEFPVSRTVLYGCTDVVDFVHH